jgi:hypothetical protein
MSDRVERIATYAEFWPYYLREHAKQKTRFWHIAGTALASVILIAALVSLDIELFFAAVIVGYAPAWLAHTFVEHNHPATLRYPFWSLISDFRMTGAWLTGRLDAELRRAHVQDNSAAH